jgi:hypothetical protein
MYTKNNTLSTTFPGSLDEIMLGATDTTTVPTKPFDIGVDKHSQVIKYEPVPYDMLAQCPKCKSLETVQFINRTLAKRSRFYQKDGKVYHDCGSDRPCQLFH